MKRVAFALFLLTAAAGFIALGFWQVERLSWKRALIAQTQEKLARPPIPAPPPEDWGLIGPDDLYTKIMVSGEYLSGKTVYVLASTRYGRGYWVLSPLKTDRGFVVFVNRGFVTAAQREGLSTFAKPVSFTGLLRLSEPGGTLLQKNRPQEDRWFSRDVAAMSAWLGLETAAPYFVDEDARAGRAEVPVAGLTVIQFPNNHLQYALTWFALAALSLAGLMIVLRDRFRTRRTLKEI